MGPQQLYDVALHPEVEKYFENHQDLAARWPLIKHLLVRSPTRGSKIVHLKARKWLCNYRWKQGRYRLFYEVIEDEGVIHVFEAGPRRDIYQKGKRRPYQG